ncbi:family 78 glycoside hydrolase catalytic domain [Larkinella sp. VNQ87]|uniref:family 78 glycoside hydrolase catalytic domain n=1 Tax=Larkinella sp. VNQ87 TaxID=3400921 RepID=UPI003BFDC94D
MKWTFYAFFLWFSFPTLAQRTIAITALRTENLTNPEGLDKPSPRLSWILTSNQRNLQQAKYQILVASSLDKLSQNQGDLWDSGEVNSDRSQWIPYGGSALSSRQVCYWKVKIRSKDGVESVWSQPASWSMGLMKATDWTAQWIGLEQAFDWDAPRAVNTRLSARYFRKQANLSKPIKKATAYVSGVGLYELALNGRKVGDAVLAPGPTEYDKRVLYNTLDVTDYLKTGDNAFGVTLGNGRYFAVRVAQPKVPATTHYGYPKLRLQVEVTYTDGSTETIVTDNSWKVTADGPIRANNEFDGEEYDATRELTNWDKTGYDASNWLTAQVVNAPASRLEAQMNPPIRVVQTLKPVSVRQLEPGKYIIDMGQNMVGWTRLTVQGARGTQVTMRFAETLNTDGSLATDNLRTAEAKDVYTLKGSGEEVWEPRFTYHGFRYIELTGFPGTPTTETLEGRIVHDDLPQTGTFTTSNDLLNKIYHNAVWSVRGNYRGIPTDCPQRDERQGWLGDRAMVSTGESFLYGNQSLYAKWLDDIESAQKPDGGIPDIVPTYWKYNTPSVTWPSAYVLIANMLYEQFGDDEPIRKHYASMKKWVTYLEKFSNDYIQEADEYGDWALPPESMFLTKSEDPARKTDGTLLNTAYYYYVLKVMERFAVLTGNVADQTSFSSRAALVRTAFNQQFLNTATNQYSNNTVTANVVALACGLVPDDRKTAVFNQITAVIEGKYNGHISTGVVGTQWLMRTLTTNGRADLAYRLATNTAYPSWGYMVQNGATTTWELWNGNRAPSFMNSYNHVMLLGDMPIWLYENLAGIKAGDPGFKSIVMRPVPTGNLNRVSSTFASAYGTVASEWTVSDQQFRWKITVPGNTTALVAVPANNLASVREGNQPADQADGVTFLRMEDGRALFQVGSGSYEFLSTPEEYENRPPVAPGFNPPAGQINKAYSYTIPAFTDPEGGTVTHALSGTVAGLSFNAQTRVLSGTPTQAGTFPLTAKATDPQGASTTAVLSLVITANLGSYEGYLDKVRCDSITGWVWNRDKPNLALNVEFLEGAAVETATLIGSALADIYRQDLKNANKGNGAHGYRFLVPESLKDNKPHTIWGRAEGGYVLKWSPKTLTCEGTATPPPVNQPPVPPVIASLTAVSGQAFSTTLPVFTDADNDPLTYSLTGAVPGLTFSTGHRTLSGTPTQAGSFTMTYAANDGKVTTSTTLTISVSNPIPVNQPPVAPSTISLTATVGQALTTNLPVFTDPENGLLTYTLSGTVPGLSFNTGNRTLSGTPTVTGTYSLTYAATDNQNLSASTSVTVSVIDAATPPSLSLAGYDGYLSTVNCEVFSGWVWHRDKPNLPLTVEFLDGATLNTATRIGTILADVFRQDLKNANKGNGNHSYSFAVPESLKDNKTHTIWARVEGTAYVLRQAPKTLTCEGTTTPPPAPNRSPVAPTIASLSAITGQTFSTTLPVFTDPDNDALTYTLGGTVPGLLFNPSNRALSGTPTQVGSFSLTYTANDGKTTASTVVALLIENPAPVDQPPVAPASVSLTATVGQTFSTTLPVFTDPENGPLTYSLTGTVPGLAFNAGNRVLNGTPATTGTYSLTYAAADNQNLTARTSVSLIVSEATSSTALSLAGYDGYLSTVNCEVFSGWVWHRDKPNLPLTVEFLDGATLNTATRIGTILADVFRQDLKNANKGNGNHSYSFAVPESLKDNKTHTIWARVEGTAYVLRQAPKTLTCEGTTTPPPPVNRPPVAPMLSPLSATTGQAFATTLPVFTDADNDALIYSLTGTIPGLSFNTGNRTLSGTPTQTGSYSLIYTANDGKTTASTTVVITVTNPAPANRAPVAPGIGPLTATVGQAFTTTLAAFTDPENGPLTYSLTGLPGGLSFNTGNRTISGTPTASGTHTLTYSATDNKSARTNLTLSLTVNAPVVTGNFEGFLDVVDCGIFAGWVWNRDQPNAAVTVEFLEGNTLATAKSVGTTSANIYREDLKNAGKGNGVHGYSFVVPSSLKTGQPRTIWGRVYGNSYVLMWSPKTLTCSPNQRIGQESLPANEPLVGLTVTPNPTNGHVVARFWLAESQKAQLRVTDAAGRSLHTRPVVGTGQVQQETFDLVQQANGLYIIQLKTGQQTHSSRVILHR